ncbi:hypothetical protein V6N13_097480 [Hibiscus sabdariffa]
MSEHMTASHTVEHEAALSVNNKDRELFLQALDAIINRRAPVSVPRELRKLRAAEFYGYSNMDAMVADF